MKGKNDFVPAVFWRTGTPLGFAACVFSPLAILI